MYSCVSCLHQEGQALVAEKPELQPVVQQTLEDLQRQWEELEGTTRTKAQCLFDANRAELFTQSCSALDVWLKNLESQLHNDDYGKDLTSVNILLKKHQVHHCLLCFRLYCLITELKYKHVGVKVN